MWQALTSRFLEGTPILKGDKLISVMLPPHSIRVAARRVDLADVPLRQQKAAYSRTPAAPVFKVAAHGEVAGGCNGEYRF